MGEPSTANGNPHTMLANLGTIHDVMPNLEV